MPRRENRRFSRTIGNVFAYLFCYDFCWDLSVFCGLAKEISLTSAASTSLDSFRCRRTLKVGKRAYDYFDLKEAEAAGLKGISRLPFSLKVLLENLLRHEDGRSVTADDIRAVAVGLKDK